MRNGVEGSSAQNSRKGIFMSKLQPRARCRGRSDCFDCQVCGEMVWADASGGQPADLEAGILDYEYEHGSVLYGVGTPVDAVHCIREGTAKMVKAGTECRRRVVRVLKAGDVAEIESIFSHAFEHTAIAVGKVRACRIPIAQFRQWAAGSTRTQMHLLHNSLLALREAETWFSQLTGGPATARTRVARLMLRLRVDAGDRIHRLGVDDMGAIIGIWPETVSRVISEFRHQGVVANGENSFAARRYFRADLPALERIAQEA